MSNYPELSGGGTILLVEDEEMINDLVKRILEKYGYTVLATTNGREAVDVYGKVMDKVSLVILNLNMPVMGGTECIGELLKIDSEVRILVSSGQFLDRQTTRTIQAAAKGFLGKPYSLKELLQAVRTALECD